MSSRASAASREISTLRASTAKIPRLATLARDDKRGGNGQDGGHRYWIVPALVVVLRCMMVPQCGHRVAFIPSRSRRFINQHKPQLGERLTACFTDFPAVPLYQRKNYKTGATPTATRTRKRFPTHLCANSPEITSLMKLRIVQQSESIRSNCLHRMDSNPTNIRILYSMQCRTMRNFDDFQAKPVPLPTLPAWFPDELSQSLSLPRCHVLHHDEPTMSIAPILRCCAIH